MGIYLKFNIHFLAISNLPYVNRQKWILKTVVGKYCLGIKLEKLPQESGFYINLFHNKSKFLSLREHFDTVIALGNSHYFISFFSFFFLDFLCKAKCYKSSWKSHLNKICGLWTCVLCVCLYIYILNEYYRFIFIHSFVVGSHNDILTDQKRKLEVHEILDTWNTFFQI